jgi:kumamolisin
VLSISWGGPESSWADASITALDNACQSAAALGVTITVASGDNGSSDGTNGTVVDFPASSPHVLACGGTALFGSTTITEEIVWDDQPQGGASGGGYSTSFPTTPTWQASALPSGKSGRGVPDVSGDASPETGYNIVVDGQQEVVGGTSAVAPLYAGLIALVNQQLATNGGPSAGFVNPTLYENPTAFNDITQGNNGQYSAGTGWDACTGLGSPRGTAILDALTAVPAPPTNVGATVS